jgi:hypothetical protein
VHLGDVAVEHDHVVAVEQRLLERDRAVVGDIGRDPAISQAIGDVVGEIDVILDHQHAHAQMVNQARSQHHYKFGDLSPAEGGVCTGWSGFARLRDPS